MLPTAAAMPTESMWTRLKRRVSMPTNRKASVVAAMTQSPSSTTKARDQDLIGPSPQQPVAHLGSPELSRMRTSSSTAMTSGAAASKNNNDIPLNRARVEEAAAPAARRSDGVAKPDEGIAPRLSRRGSVASIAHSIRSTLARRSSVSRRPSVSSSAPATSTSQQRQRPVLAISTSTVTAVAVRTDSNSTVSRSGSGSSGGYTGDSIESVSTAPTTPECMTPSGLPPPQSPFRRRPPPTFSPIHGPCPEVYIIPSPAGGPPKVLRSVPSSPAAKSRVATADLVFGSHQYDHRSVNTTRHQRARSLDGSSSSSNGSRSGGCSRWSTAAMPPPPQIPTQWQAEPRARPFSTLAPATLPSRSPPPSVRQNARPASAYLTPKSSFEQVQYDSAASSRRSSDAGHHARPSRCSRVFVNDLLDDSDDEPVLVGQKTVLKVVNPDCESPDFHPFWIGLVY